MSNYVLPDSLLQAIISYLANRPFIEVNKFILALHQLKMVESPSIPSELPKE